MRAASLKPLQQGARGYTIMIMSVLQAAKELRGKGGGWC